jgi:VTC domain
VPAEREACGMPFDVSRLNPVTLPEVMASAAQLTRVDRKYLVPVQDAQAVLDRLGGTHRLLVIDGRQCTTYRSTYFDTPDLATARAHVQGRRRRWKARTRLYVEDQLCRLEVKTKDARGATVKSVVERDTAHYGRLRPEDVEFIGRVLPSRSVPCASDRLHPTAEVTYQRVTLADTEQSDRITVDWNMACHHGRGQVRLDHGFVLLETKGGARPGLADRILGAQRNRPSPFSKYVSGVCLLRHDLPANDFRALSGRQLHCSNDTEQERAS